ncbi:MAG TPA: phosphoribosylformylglycinamidine cyclo-ligase [Chloroflexia bacterium]|nr:phosphoribosylformylglycinamidine cyclo-ligase [Chloroflexia bacterium]
MLEARQESAYRQAGVDIDAGSRAVEGMKEAVRSTFGPRVLADVGLFGGLYALDERPDGQVLVASTDSVGTKLKLASLLGTHSLLGHDIVNHCTNDVLACGAKPIFFLDYFAAGKIVPEQVIEIVTGMAEACRAAGCALIGGETAELPGVYNEGEFDVVGTIVGMARRDMLVLGDRIVPGDIALALPSSGLHTNGYSLARKVFGLDGSPEKTTTRLMQYAPELGRTLGASLTEPHRSYLPEIGPLLEKHSRPIKGMAHITGGGLIDNIPRILPSGCAVELDTTSWKIPPLFQLIQSRGNIPDAEMRRVFNMGLGMVVIVSPGEAGNIIEGTPAFMQVGRVIEQQHDERVLFRD